MGTAPAARDRGGMPSPHSTPSNLAARAGRWSAEHRRAAILGWIAFLVAAVVLGQAVGFKELSNDGVGESGRADQALNAAFPQDPEETVLVQSTRHTARDAAFKDTVDDVVRRLKAERYVKDVARGAVSPDGHRRLIALTLDADDDNGDERVAGSLAATAAAQRAHPGFRIGQFGDASLDRTLGHTQERDFQRAEKLSLPITLVILLVAFGSLVAAGLPLLLALSAVMATLGLVAVATHLTPMDDTVNSVVLLVGLAVGVDYSLFYLRREREERARGLGPRAALEAAAATSGRAVLISGVTVIIAMAGMYLAGQATFTGLATGSILVVAVALIASVSVLPAFLSLMGDKVEKGRIPVIGRRMGRAGESRAWGFVLDRVLRRPVVALVVAVAVLLALAAPALNMRTALPGMDSLPRDTAVMRTYDRLQAAFPGDAHPATVAVQAGDVTRPDVAVGIAALRKRAVATGVMHEPITVDVSPDRTIAAVHVPIDGDGTDRASEAALHRLRGDVIPSTIGHVDGVRADVTGMTAGTSDFDQIMRSRAPLVFAFVLGLAFLLLLVTFRSLVVPLKAIVLNLLSVGAAYGLLTLVFQHGRGEPITAWLPMFLFVILFGLSMDYHVFILSRIREGVDRGLSTREAVAGGIRTTAGVVTSAAVVMVAVFAVFATLSGVEFQEMGLGLAAAILIDATIIRAVVLPAAMTLLGERNWWLPRRLSWLPRLAHSPA
jgi:RND superfamily putative drug exporter